MNLGIKRRIISVKELYEYAIKHNLLYSEASIVLDIINRERNPDRVELGKKESIVSPTNNTDIIDFGTHIEYTYEEVLALLST